VQTRCDRRNPPYSAIRPATASGTRVSSSGFDQVALGLQSGIESPANVRTAFGIVDDVAQGSVRDMTCEVVPKRDSLGAVSAVLLP
jgi:hypothetical protein